MDNTKNSVHPIGQESFEYEPPMIHLTTTVIEFGFSSSVNPSGSQIGDMNSWDW